MTRKTRAISADADVASARYQLFKAGFARINDAIEHRYYLEAICLIESLLADRMESRVMDHKDHYRGFDCLGTILKHLAEETDPKLQELNNEANEWRAKRNDIHEVMKIDAEHLSEWSTRITQLRATAISGRKLLRQYDQALRSARRESSSRTASEKH